MKNNNNPVLRALGTNWDFTDKRDPRCVDCNEIGVVVRSDIEVPCPCRFKLKAGKMSKWRKYKRVNFIEMRPLVPCEDMTNVFVSSEDLKEVDDCCKFKRREGMIARNPNNPDYQWYISKKCFLNNFDQV